jgi:hypothetical protein
MRAPQIDSSAKSAAPELDEAFLRRVDQTVLLSKQRDPFRMDQVHRCLTEEVALGAFDGQQRDWALHRGRPRLEP